jgi:hypothetical protein
MLFFLKTVTNSKLYVTTKDGASSRFVHREISVSSFLEGSTKLQAANQQQFEKKLEAALKNKPMSQCEKQRVNSFLNGTTKVRGKKGDSHDGTLERINAEIIRRLNLLLNSIEDQHPIETLDELLFENNNFCCEVIPSSQEDAININRMKMTCAIAQNDSIALITLNPEDRLKILKILSYLASLNLGKYRLERDSSRSDRFVEIVEFVSGYTNVSSHFKVYIVQRNYYLDEVYLFKSTSNEFDEKTGYTDYQDLSDDDINGGSNLISDHFVDKCTTSTSKESTLTYFQSKMLQKLLGKYQSLQEYSSIVKGKQLPTKIREWIMYNLYTESGNLVYKFKKKSIMETFNLSKDQLITAKKHRMNGESAHGSIGRIGFHSNKAHLAVARTLFEKFLFENYLSNGRKNGKTRYFTSHFRSLYAPTTAIQNKYG